eukprot:CAMPEP_0196192868 /NCGR_PEP_ID=MMETSP0911-20130528/49245_1 /TAXON_ID=49265 /ORGANISM="Thalassiosira rotula, Strain GSO102" /LENGTH=490 /DNA_ID=CAMNT_0041465081 /DNA_START=612 /DNA_END=2084 /DNA_ORIENTATION=-
MVTESPRHRSPEVFTKADEVISEAKVIPETKENDNGSNVTTTNEQEPLPITTIPKNDSLEDDAFDLNFDITSQPLNDGPDTIRNKEIISLSTPTTDLEHALKAELNRQIHHNELLVGECTKLRGFISKRKQTYKRKRKDESAPRKKLSGYNLFVRERFAKIAKANEDALKNADSGAELKRIPPASHIASSGHAWSQLSAEEKARYNEMAKPDEDRFQKETADYTAPEKLSRKRAKTGYNVFFSKHVLELKHNDVGVPSERGSVARIVGDAWKKMNAEEKDSYERQADEQNDTSHSDMEHQQQQQQQQQQQEEHQIHPPQMPPPHPHHPPPPQMMMMGPPPPGTMPPPHLDTMGPPLMPPPPDQMLPPPPHMDPLMDEHGAPLPPPMDDGGGPPMPPGPLGDPNMGPIDPNMPPPPYPPDYGMHGPPLPVIHQPPGYEHGYGPYPPFDPYAYPPGGYQGGPPPPYPPGMPPPPGYGPPPLNYPGPPPNHYV